MKEKWQNHQVRRCLVGLCIFISVLFFLSCGATLQMTNSSLDSMAPSEGLIFGSVQIEVFPLSEKERSFWNTSLEDATWLLELRKERPKEALSNGYQITAVAGGEEVHFMARLTTGDYQFCRMNKLGLTSLGGPLDITFHVAAGKTTYIGKLLLHIPAEIKRSGRIYAEIEDHEYATTSALAKEQGIEVVEAHVVKGLMVNETRKKIFARLEKMPLDGDVSKFVDIIKGNDQFLRRITSETIVQQKLFDLEILDAVNRTLLEEFKIDFKATHSTRIKASHHIDALAWFCKILGSSGNSGYISTLEYVSKEAANKKIKGYAKRSLEQLKRSDKDKPADPDHI